MKFFIFNFVGSFSSPVISTEFAPSSTFFFLRFSLSTVQAIFVKFRISSKLNYLFLRSSSSSMVFVVRVGEKKDIRVKRPSPASLS